MSDGFFSIFNAFTSFTHTQKPNESQGLTLSTLEDDYDISLVIFLYNHKDKIPREKKHFRIAGP